MSVSDLENPIVTLLIGAALGIIGSVASQLVTGYQAHKEARYEFFRDNAKIVSAYLTSLQVFIGSIRRLLEEEQAKKTHTENLLEPLISNELTLDRFNRIRETHIKFFCPYGSL